MSKSLESLREQVRAQTISARFMQDAISRTQEESEAFDDLIEQLRDIERALDVKIAKRKQRQRPVTGPCRCPPVTITINVESLVVFGD